MGIFYFTYGIDGHPFMGGWTEINAPTDKIACGIFRAYHPDKIKGLYNCAGIYTQEQFISTGMSETGNLGHKCHEIIIVERLVRRDPTT